jgi:hypothetical protein
MQTHVGNITDTIVMAPVRMGRNIMFSFQIVIFSLCNFIKHFVGNTLQIICICHQDSNIIKYITCTHYTQNTEDNHGILLWCGNLDHNKYKDPYWF